MFNLFKNKSQHRFKIIISVDHKDMIDVSYQYDKNDTEKSYKIATLLFCMNNKLLTRHLIEGLLKDGDAIFATEVVGHWSSFDNTEDKNNEPIIQPLNAFSKNVK